MIREFQRDDINKVADIWLDTNIKAHNFIPAEYWKSNFKSVKEALLLAEVYVYEYDTEIQGFIGLKDEYTGRSNFTNLKAIGSYSGNVAYCIEPGISLKVGQTMNKYDENYFNNLAANGGISGDEIRLFVGRILQYGYRGTISTSWRSQNEAAANSIA